MKALIIDDSLAMRSILTRIVTQLGFDCVEASNGQEGLTRLDEVDDISLVLVDWNMPEMNGLDFVKVVRTKPEYEKLPLMMVTTETEPMRMALALMAGVDEFVMKPFTPEILSEKINLLGIRPTAAT